MHTTIEPSILYFGTPVALLSTRNEDGSGNLAPMSSIWWLGWNCMLGLGGTGHTVGNLRRERECVINLPCAAMVDAVDRLAMLTGSDPVPAVKAQRGYRHEAQKFETAGLTPIAAELVGGSKVAECPVQLEAVVEAEHPFGHRPDRSCGAAAFEMRIIRVHVDEAILRRDIENHIDPDLWRPLIMSFCQFYGTGNRLHTSRLAQIPEISYRPAATMQR
jgi:flavin reductase (DIM6/NTAB) family NADH-FMN oxidoreductase RutF